MNRTLTLLQKFEFPKLKNNNKIERLTAPSGFWSSLENRAKWLIEIGKKIGVKELNDWYKVSRNEFLKNGGSKVLKYYSGSLARALEALIPHSWEPWKFEIAPRGFWTTEENQKRFLEHLASKYKFNANDPVAWAKVTEDIVKIEGGSGLLNHFGNLTKALEHCFPNINFSSRKINPQGYWYSKENQRNFFQKVAKEMNLSFPDGWYSVSHEDIASRGGYGLLNLYKGSFIKALQTLFPEHVFLTWKFSKVYPNFWNNEENVRKYLSWLSTSLSIQKYEDWYSVSTQQITDSGAKSLISKYGGIYQILSKYFPEYKWDPLEFSKPKILKTQNLLAFMVQKIWNLNDSQVLSDYTHPSLVDKNSGKPISLDVYIPEYEVAIEYEGIQRVNEQSSTNKQDVFKDAGILFISIPKTWDQSEASLEATLKKYKINSK